MTANFFIHPMGEAAPLSMYLTNISPLMMDMMWPLCLFLYPLYPSPYRRRTSLFQPGEVDSAGKVSACKKIDTGQCLVYSNI